jgi:hypothetical protein
VERLGGVRADHHAVTVDDVEDDAGQFVGQGR